MTLDHTIRQAYINTLLDGGFTRLADKTTNPTEGYIVGGVVEPTTMKLDAVATSITYRDAMQYEEFKELWHKYEMELDEMPFTSGMGVGTWIHEGQIYFDLVQRIYNLDVATRVAKERGEIAIYDCKSQKEILL
jgi:hypothetical protein|tara:strand:- start:545 stop:946 length:402 start_codon:yes stop_codon:yes gene_type:complete